MIKKIDPNSWDLYFIKMAELVSTKSKDPSTKVGVVIVGEDNEVLSTGFNGFPRGVDEVNYPERWERPEKYSWVIHAEANAVANAARVGVSLKGGRCYINFTPTPCTGCATLLIQSGVSAIIGPNRPFTGVGTGTYYDTEDVAYHMLEEVYMKRLEVKVDDN